MRAQQERRRLENLAAIRMALGEQRGHFVADYIPGQVVYNLSEYPVYSSLAPTSDDEALLQQLAEAGVGLIQIHEDWNDSQRLLGADKFSSYDPAGLEAFVELVHRLGMKIIPYISSGYFDIRDPDFDERWFDATRDRLIELYFDYAHCSPASPEWRAYLLEKVEQLLDRYGFDGLYNDLGYDRRADALAMPEGQIRPGPESHAALEDLLGILYGLVKRRGGVMKVHGLPPEIAARTRVYDYLWVGEGVESLEVVRQQSKDLPPYVVPCPDMSRARVVDEHDLYLYTIPYMQFPLRVDGRPVTGERACAPGVSYQSEERCFWTRHMRAVARFYQEHPEGPYTYGWWDSCPGRPEARQIWLNYFALYKPMVTPGSYVWTEVPPNPIFDWRLPPDVVASFFVNEEIYLVLANYGTEAATVASPWLWEDRQTKARGRRWTLAPRQLLFLRRADGED